MRIKINVYLVFFIVASSVVHKMQSSINIDTRQESNVGGQVFRSFVLDSLQTFSSSFDYAYGDVEFRAGIKAMTNDSRTLSLGITGLLGGALILGQGLTEANFNVFNDLTLSITSFNGPNLGPFGLNTFNFRSQNPCTFFLDNDLTMSQDALLRIFAQGGLGGTIFDGRNYKIVLTSGSAFSVVQLSGPFTIKNCRIEGITASTYGAGSTNNGFIGFMNVQLITNAGQTIELADTKCRFFGQHNVIGYGGIADFSQNERTSITIATESQLYIAPDTTLVLNHVSSFNKAPVIAFVDTTSVLFLDNCNIQVGGPENPNNQIPFIHGTMIINGNVTLTARDGGILRLGDGLDPANNFNVVILPGSKLIVADGATLLNKNI